MKKYLVSTVILSLLLASAGTALMNNGWAVANTTDVSLVRTFVSADGRQIDELVFPGKPPQVSHVTSVSVPEPHIEMGINNLSNVPAFDWCYGCSPTSAAMLFGYYDRTGYNSMYTGPTNGGMCPLDNSIWGGDECPLSATHEGIDGQTDRGHIGDYWIKYGNNGPDPYIVDGLSEHVHCACTADFMGTNQSKFGNSDGCTTFYCCTNGDPLYDYADMEPLVRDGCHGMRLFAESRGYTVLENYSQYIKGQGSDPNRGFTFEDFMAEIDAGHPVLIHVVGHTMLGYGYNTTGNIIYIHSTWDYSDHEMTWGGTFSGLQHKMVTVIQLAGGTPPPTPDEPPSVITDDAANITQTSASLMGSLQDMGTAVTVYVSFQWGTAPGSYPNETITETLSTTAIFDAQLTDLQPNTTYYFRARAVGDGTVYGSQRQFTTLEEIIDQPPSVITNDAVSITQTSASLVASLQDMGTAETVDVSFQWGTAPGSYPNETITETMSTTADFDAQLTDLQPNTTYYFRARAVGDGTVYGSQRQFTTLEEIIDEPPSVITDDAVNVTQTSASLVASLQDMGTAETVDVSFQWGTAPGSYPNETITETMSTTADFDAQLTDLQPNTTYYFRARAVCERTSYGLDKSFITSQVAEVVVSIKPKNQTVPSGGSFSVDVEVDSRGIPITDCDVTVTFDPHLTATLLNGGNLLGTAGLDAQYLPTIDVGEVSYVGYRIDSSIAVNGDFMTINFNVDPAAAGTYALVVAATLMDSNGDPVAVVDDDGRVKIRTKGRKGDANSDGVVNSLDITKVERIVVGMDARTPEADANQDDVVNSLDITKVERIIAGLD